MTEIETERVENEGYACNVVTVEVQTQSSQHLLFCIYVCVFSIHHLFCIKPED